MAEAEAAAAPAATEAAAEPATEAAAPVAEAMDTKEATEAPAAEGEAAAQEDEVTEFVQVDVPAEAIDKFAGRLPEVARLSGARLGLMPAKDGVPRKVKVDGTPLKVARAKVLLQSETTSAPGTEVATGSSESAGSKALVVAGRGFADRDELEAHIKNIQNNCKDGQMLGPEDSFFLFHLSTFHPSFLDKMTAPVTGFKYGLHADFPGTKCFFVVRADGTEEGISARKCMEVPFPVKGKKRAREEERPAQDGDAAEEEPPAHKPRREIQEGCIVIIEGIPADMEYGDLKDLLNEYGNARFVEFIRGPRAAAATEAEEKPAAEKAADKAEEKTEAKTEEKADEKADEKAEEKAEEKTEVKTEVKTEEKAAEKPAEKVDVKTEEPAAAAPATETPAAQASASADAPAASTEDATMEDAEEAADEEEEPLRTARARFAESDGAKKCAEELKEVEGHPVTVRLLEGEEERQFWERLWAASDAKGGKGKGKKGKDKGKGKGKDKGKKGKGKGKGKKGKSRDD